MKSFIDNKKISSYSEALAEKLCNNFFSVKACITGEEIKSFTPVEQINLFILKNLFEKWKDETRRLKSPYFNYEATEVKAALQNLINTLSNHISVSRELFKPLVAKAIENTILIAASPVEYLRQELISSETVNIEFLKRTDKFHKINKEYFKAALKYMEESGKSEISADTLLKAVEARNFEMTKPDEIVQQLSDLLKIEINDILIQPEINLEEGLMLQTTPDIPQESGEIEKPMESGQGAVHKEEIEPEGKAEQITNEQEIPIYERFTTSATTLNETHTNPADNIFSTEKINDLKTAIPLSHKFLYIKELFQDKAEDYTRAIDELEKKQDFAMAVNYLKDNFAIPNRWDFSDSVVREFLNLVERRFS
jgi:hypothetical protein